MPQRRIAFDCETHLIRAGMLFPRVVCVTFSEGGLRDWIQDRYTGVLEVLDYLRDPDIVLVGHNAAYDVGVVLAELIALARDPRTALLVPSEQDIMEIVFTAYLDGRISDTGIRSMLVDIARGRFQEIDGQRRGKEYGLDRLALRWCNIVLPKADTWRLHYAYLDGTPIQQWPADAVDYAIRDANTTALVDIAITDWIIAEGMEDGEIPDAERQTRAAWVLHLMAGWGVRVDSEEVARIKADLLQRQKQYYAVLNKHGVFKTDREGNFKRTKKGAIQKNQKVLQDFIAQGFQAQGKTPPTNSKGVSTAADVARESGNPVAVAFADVANIDKLLSTYVPILERGAQGLPITSAPNVLVASGRTSWTNPNWQNPPRAGGIRECVIARPGTVLVAADLDTVELRGLAQACIEIVGYSVMGDAIKAGQDLHLAVAAEILGLDYDDAKARYDAGDAIVSEARQTAKKANFSLPGGVGAKKFAWMYYDDDQPLCTFPDGTYDQAGSEVRAQQIKDAWLNRWREMRDYLRNAGDICGPYGDSTVIQPWSGRVRGGLDYCSCANTYFQGRVADGAKLALWRLAWACYVDTTSPLYGSRLVLFLHDEVILECPEDRLHECSEEIVRILVGAVQEVIPDIPITSAAVAFRRWYKGAKPVKVNGRLVPCRPVKVGKKVTWEADLPVAA
jgi:DNA polymerase-1